MYLEDMQIAMNKVLTNLKMEGIKTTEEVQAFGQDPIIVGILGAKYNWEPVHYACYYGICATDFTMHYSGEGNGNAVQC